MPSIRDQRGSILVTVLVTVAIMVMLGGSLLALGSNDLALASGQLRSQQAFYLAEAGLQRAERELKYNPAWKGTGSGWVGLDPGSYKVAVTNQGAQYTVTSTGKVGAATKEISITGVRSSSSDYAIPTYTKAGSGGVISQISGAVIGGDLYVNEAIQWLDAIRVTGGDLLIVPNWSPEGTSGIEYWIGQLLQELFGNTSAFTVLANSTIDGDVHVGGDRGVLVLWDTQVNGNIYFHPSQSFSGTPRVYLMGGGVTGKVYFAQSGYLEEINLWNNRAKMPPKVENARSEMPPLRQPSSFQPHWRDAGGKLQGNLVELKKKDGRVDDKGVLDLGKLSTSPGVVYWYSGDLGVKGTVSGAQAVVVVATGKLTIIGNTVYSGSAGPIFLDGQKGIVVSRSASSIVGLLYVPEPYSIELQGPLTLYGALVAGKLDGVRNNLTVNHDKRVIADFQLLERNER